MFQLFHASLLKILIFTHTKKKLTKLLNGSVHYMIKSMLTTITAFQNNSDLFIQGMEGVENITISHF